MKNFLAFDTEDNSKELCIAHGHSRDKQLTQIAAMGMGTKFHSRGDREKFKEWLSGFPPNTVCYAHNLTYDLGNIFGGELDAIEIKMVGSRMIRARWRNIVFLDSFNIWPMSLKKLGEAFGLKKLEFDAENEAYVFRDVEIVHAAMMFARSMAADYGVERMPTTLGGLCVKVWQEMGGQTWQCSDDMARDALFGGRVELFAKGGKGRVYYVDINSLYPSVMCNKFPTRMENLNDIKGYGVAHVHIDVPPMFIAPLPVRDADDRIYYPTGKLEGVWTFHEIQNAISCGAKVTKLIKACGSIDGEYYYDNFVRHFYAKRKTAKNNAEKMMFKLLLNNRYGQLGMKGSVTQSVPLHDADFNADGYYRGDGIPYGGKKLAEIQMPIPDHVNYLHAAYVTSYGRLRLQHFLRLVDPDSLIYCDTDSIIFFNENDKLPFPISGEMGEMKLEGIAHRCYTVAPKMYLFGHHLKVKGVPKRRIENGKRKYIPACEIFRTGETSYFQPYKFRESVRFYDVRKSSDGKVLNDFNSRPLSVWRQVIKKHKSDYEKKTILNGRYFPKKISMI